MIIEVFDVEIEEIVIDEGFKYLLPRLDDMSYRGLEASLLEHGCLSPLVTWNNVLIDGHNRYEIMKRHGMPMRIIKMEFGTREDVIIWIIKTQVERRNLNLMQLRYFRGVHYNMERIRPGSVNQHTKVANAQNEQEQIFESTAQRLSDRYNVSPVTIRRDAKLADAINAIGEKSPEAKERILSEQGNISRARLQELASAGDDELVDTIEQINAGTHTKRRGSDSQQSELSDRLTLDGFISKIARELDSGIKKLAKGDTGTSKIAIRSLITKLEELYASI